MGRYIPITTTLLVLVLFITVVIVNGDVSLSITSTIYASPHRQGKIELYCDQPNTRCKDGLLRLDKPMSCESDPDPQPPWTMIVEWFTMFGFQHLGTLQSKP